MTYFTSSVENVPISELWFILIYFSDLKVARDSRGASVNVNICSVIYYSYCGMKKANKLATLKYLQTSKCVCDADVHRYNLVDILHVGRILVVRTQFAQFGAIQFVINSKYIFSLNKHETTSLE